MLTNVNKFYLRNPLYRLYENNNDKSINDNECSPELVVELKKQLREKDLVLTDIRLEALSSAHQLESLKDTVIKMRVRLMLLFNFHG